MLEQAKVTGRHSFNEDGDISIASLLILCMAFGIPGNSMAFVYFWHRRKRTIYDKLYVLITLVDVFISLLPVPVIASLFHKRAPEHFHNSIFCHLWWLTIFFLVRISIFLVALMSIIRTIAITKPSYFVIKKGVFLSIAVYSVWMVLIYSIYLGMNWHNIAYHDNVAYCMFLFDKDGTPEYAVYFLALIIIAELVLPTIIIFVSFITGIYTLLKIKPIKRHDNEKFKTASVTIAVFTGIFLFCNTPMFVLQIVRLISLSDKKIAAFMMDDKGPQYWYVRITMQFFPVVLNAALNPCIYAFRLPRYRNWVEENIRRVSSGEAPMVESCK